MRKLASIRRIRDIQPIAGADSIELAIVDGWQSVTKKGEYQIGDLVIYCEVDSFLPHHLAPFLTKPGHHPKEFSGIIGERLRTMKLRGALSQGLILPLQATYSGGLPYGSGVVRNITGEECFVNEGDDVTDFLGIVKWEAPIPVQLAGQVRGNFPTLVPKTDQERCQNLIAELKAAQGRQFEVTEKLDGSSCTMYLDSGGEFHVCSRNLDLLRDNKNSYWGVADRLEIERRMVENNLFGYAIQGELVGPGIQGNRYGLKELNFYVFDVYDTRGGDYLQPDARRSFVKNLGLDHVPVVMASWTLDCEVPELLRMAEGPSLVNKNTEREGFVFKQVNGGMSFKAISNKFLLGEK